MADYGINIGVNVQSGQLNTLTRELKELRKIEQDLSDLKKQGLVEDKQAAQLRRRAKDQASQLKQQTKDLAKAFTLSGNAVQGSAGSLRNYVTQLKDARTAFSKGGADARIFTEAITKADFTATVKSLKNFNLEAKETARALGLLTQGFKGGPRFGAFTGMKDLLAFQPANTTDALTNYSAVLEKVILKVDRASDTYKELAARIAEVNNQMAGTPGRMGPATDLDSPEAAAQRAAFNRRNRERRNKRFKGAAGGALLSGGFPLLMGQSMTASAVGGIGGGIGGALGGTFGFALGIIGTAIGEAIEKQLKFNQTLKDLNVSFAQAGGNSKIFAGDIDNLAESLKITKEEALGLAKAFAFLGDKNLVSGAAKLFGSKQRFDLFAGISDEASFAAVVLDIANEFGDIQAIQLLNDAKGKDFDDQRILATTRLNKLKEKTVKLTKEELSPTQRRQSARRSVSVTALRTPVSQEEATGITESRANLLKQLAQLKDKGKTGGSVSDPTVGLQKRLDIVLGQINSEEDLLELQGKQSELSRIILRQEKAITKAKATGAAERKNLVDEEDKKLSRAIEAGSIEAANLKFSRESLALADKTLKKTENLAKPLQDQLDTIKDKAAFEREYGELIRAGVIPAVAQQTVEINKQVKEIDRLMKKQLDEIDLQIESLQLQVDKAAGKELEVKLQERLNEALKRRKEIESKGANAKGAARDAAKTPADRIQDEMDRVQGVLNDLIDPANQVILAAQAIGDAFSESFRGLITGSMSAQEALANLFSRTADHFADMAAQMIAKQIQMKILGIGLNFLGGAAGFMSPAASPGGSAGVAGIGGGMTNPIGNTSLFDAPFSLPLAKGGFVSGPTRALIGEGGESEYVVPASKMNEAMGRYARGARGAAVIPDGSGGDAGGEMSGSGGSIDVSYSVERINNVNYVTAAEFERGMNQAAKRGAELGRQGVYSDLVNKRSIRSRIGV